MFAKPGISFDPTAIPSAIKGAGFTSQDIVVTVEGTMSQRQGFLELKVPGLVRPFVLSGGKRVDELRNEMDLLGKNIRIVGLLHPSNADRPPGLTVESFHTSRQDIEDEL